MFQPCASYSPTRSCAGDAHLGLLIMLHALICVAIMARPGAMVFVSPTVQCVASAVCCCDSVLLLQCVAVAVCCCCSVLLLQRVVVCVFVSPTVQCVAVAMCRSVLLVQFVAVEVCCCSCVLLCLCLRLQRGRVLLLQCVAL